MIFGYSLINAFQSISTFGQPSPSSAIAADPGSVIGAAPQSSTPGGYVGNPPDAVPFGISKSNYEAVFTELGGVLSAADLLFVQIDKNGDGVIDQDELLARGNSNCPALATFGQQPPSSTNADAGSVVGTALVKASFDARVQDGDNGQPGPSPQSSAASALPDPNWALNWLAPNGPGLLTQVQGGESTPGGYVGNPPAPVPFDISKANYEAVFTALGGALSAADLLFAQIDSNGDGVIDQNELLARGNSNNPALAAGNPGGRLGNALQSISTFGQQQPSSTNADAGSVVGTALVKASFDARVPDGDNGQRGSAPQSSALPALPESNRTLNWLAPNGPGLLTQVQGGESTPGGYVGNPPAPVPFDISKANYEAVFTALGGALSAADLLFAQIDSNGDGVIDQNELLARGNSNNPALSDILWQNNNAQIAPSEMSGAQTAPNANSVQLKSVADQHPDVLSVSSGKVDAVMLPQLNNPPNFGVR
jgi:EF hand domain-containing protein